MGSEDVYKRQSASHPYGLTVGPDGNIWFTEHGGANIGRINISNGAITEFPIPGSPTRQPYDITKGSDGNLWYAGEGGRVSKITTSGVITEYTVSQGTNGDPHGITLGADGNVWFTERFADVIGMITPDGTITEYTIPTASSDPFLIAPGPNNTIWFAESSTSKIGRLAGLTIPAAAPTSTTPNAPDTGAGIFAYDTAKTIGIASLIGASSFATAYIIHRRLRRADGSE